MTDLQQTLAEIEAMIPKLEWEILDEEQKDEFIAKIVERDLYMATTSDGHKLGPTFWAEKVGASSGAIQKRVERAKASQKPGYHETTRAGSRARHLRSALRSLPSEQIAEIIESDPAIATNVARAAQRVEQAAVERTHAAQRERSPDLVHRGGFNEVAGELLKVKRTYATTLNKVRELDLESDEAEALDEQIDGIGAITDWFHSFLRSGSRGFEQDLENLLAEGR